MQTSPAEAFAGTESESAGASGGCGSGAFRHRLAQPFQHLAALRAQTLRFGFGNPQKRLDMVARSQGGAHQRGSGRDAAGPDAIEYRFQFVCEGGDGVKTEHGARALNGMQRAEDPAHQFRVAGPVLQFQ